MLTKINVFAALAVVITLLLGALYLIEKTNLRLSANDPQIQISEDITNYLSKGQDAENVMPKSTVDVSKSLAWVLITYDDSGQVKASNAVLNGQIPELPKGVLDHARDIGQNRVTWEPEKGVRIAAVVTRYDNGYVLVGRSLRDVEGRFMVLGKIVAVSWIITILTAYVFIFHPPNLKIKRN